MRDTDLSHDLNELAKHMYANSRRWFPHLEPTPEFFALGLIGECGEVANLTKKVVRGSHTVNDIRPLMAEELADVFTYLMLLAESYGLDLIGCYRDKETICEGRWG